MTTRTRMPMPMTFTAVLAAVLTVALPGTALAQVRGSGSGALSDTLPVTRGSGTAPEQAQLPIRDSQIVPRHGVLGAPGGAPDAHGGSGAALRAGAGAEPGPEWTAGDRVRSISSAEVRAARVQQAPDLEWGESAAASAGPAVPPPTPARAAPAAKPARAKRSGK